jgi:L-amino acid N-acyltransferase YncA
VREATVYVAPEARGGGIGRALLEALAAEAAARGRHKLVAKVFADNEPSLALSPSLGYREVGVHRRHGRLDGEWRDVVVLERLLMAS